MKYSVSLIFVLALAAPLLSDCHAVPQYGIGPPLGAGSLYPDYDWTPPYDSEPSLGIGQVVVTIYTQQMLYHLHIIIYA